MERRTGENWRVSGLIKDYYFTHLIHDRRAAGDRRFMVVRNKKDRQFYLSSVSYHERDDIGPMSLRQALAECRLRNSVGIKPEK